MPDFSRSEWYNLNGTWDFSFDRPAFDRTIEVPYPWGSPLSGISESKAGVGYYRRTVSWNPSGERITLCFGAVDYLCTVTVNQIPVGSHRGGYNLFRLDVTDAWNREGENEIIVAATDTNEKSQTYGKQGYGDARGIWQTVWLEARPHAHIDSFSVKTALDGTVTYDVILQNAEDGDTVTASFPDARPTGGTSATVQNNRAALTFTIDSPNLWSPETPYLYEGSLALTHQDQTDTVSTYFGVREIGTGVFGQNQNRYITLNGKPYFLNGVLDQSFNPQGYFTLPSDQDCRDEILRVKRLGLNMARIHIKAEEPLKLYWADRLGLLIMEDIPCFWGEPTPETRAQFEIEMEEQMLRDRNHPSVFYWVIFNETWGLKSAVKKPDGSEQICYTDDTAHWVESCWKRAKALDPTRPVEDNSVCLGDHTLTDVNTWHFYANGYDNVKKVIGDFCKNAFPGSSSNYKNGYVMGDVPCMNSECGNVWGIEGSAGDSDISWQYKYMMNEFRLHDKIGGFVFTEFHDVINEFNGYYKINNDDKDFGYSAYHMSLHDLHAQDYLGADFPPMKTVKPLETVTVPLFASSFSDRNHGKTLHVRWQLRTQDPLHGDAVALTGQHDVLWRDYGTFDAGSIQVTMPHHDGIASLEWTLSDDDSIIMHNAVLFDIDGNRDDVLALEPKDFTATGWERAFCVQAGRKWNGLGSGEISTEIDTASVPGLSSATHLRVLAEASTRAPMTHDYPEKTDASVSDGDYMLGYRCDPGANPSSFTQTDQVKHSGMLEILIDGIPCDAVYLPDCPADSRGALSHHYQEADNHLDEAGSYGTLCDVQIPSALLLRLKEKKSFTLTFRTTDGSGLSLFGRQSGRYGIGVILHATEQ